MLQAELLSCQEWWHMYCNIYKTSEAILGNYTNSYYKPGYKQTSRYSKSRCYGFFSLLIKLLLESATSKASRHK